MLPPQDGYFHLDCTLAEGGPTRPFGLDLSGVDLILTVSDISSNVLLGIPGNGSYQPNIAALSWAALLITSAWEQSTEHGGIGLCHAADVEMSGPCSIRHSPEAWPFGQAVLTSVSDDKIKWTIQV